MKQAISTRWLEIQIQAHHHFLMSFRVHNVYLIQYQSEDSHAH